MNDDQLTIGSIAERALRQYPDQVVVTARGPSVSAMTYGDLFERVYRLVRALRALGVQPGDRVATVAWNHRRHLELYLAVPCMGAVLHTINLRLHEDQVADIVAHAGDTVVVVDEDCLPVVGVATRSARCVRHWVVLRDDAPGPLPDGVAWLDYEELLADQEPKELALDGRVDERAPAAMCYSSATTGKAKGVVYSHRAIYLHSMMLGLADTWGISEWDTALVVVPMFHVNAWGIPYASVWMGAKLVLPGVRPRAADLAALLHSEQVTFTAGVPSVWAEVAENLRTSGVALPHLRLVVSGGAPLSPKLLDAGRQAGLPIIHSYGMTEASPLVLVGGPGPALQGEPEDVVRSAMLAQGRLVPGLAMSVRDEYGHDVPRDGMTTGELWLKGPWIADGYVRDPRSAAAFSEGWYRTGDVVTVDRRGYVRVVDREADLIKSGGEWISTIDVENAILDLAGVRGAAVVGVPDERWQERPVAFVVLDEPLEQDAIRRHLRQKVPRWWVPDEVVVVEEIPLTSVGKTDKKELRRRWHVDAGGTSRAEPAATVPQQVQT